MICRFSDLEGWSLGNRGSLHNSLYSASDLFSFHRIHTHAVKYNLIPVELTPQQISGDEKKAVVANVTEIVPHFVFGKDLRKDIKDEKLERAAE